MTDLFFFNLFRFFFNLLQGNRGHPTNNWYHHEIHMEEFPKVSSFNSTTRTKKKWLFLFFSVFNKLVWTSMKLMEIK